MCLTQMSTRKGIKMFGGKAPAALLKEYEQLEDLQVFELLEATDLTFDEKTNSLNAIDQIKQKRCSKLKGRTVADGSKQQNSFTKAEVSSPTLSLEGFLATLIIDAQENQHVAIADVIGAFLKADMDDFMVIKLQGHAVNALLDINKEKYQ